MIFLRQTIAIAAKDLRLETRGREAVNTVAPFAAMVLVAFGFAFGPGRATLARAAPGLLWITAVFAGILSLKRAYDSETENGAFEGMLLLPVDRAAIYLGKLTAALVVMLGIQVLGVGLVAALFGFEGTLRPGILVAASLLGTLGLAAVGSLYSALAASARAREALLPLLMLPAVVPVLIGAIRATEAAFGGADAGAGGWLKLLVGFDVVAVAVCTVAFEHLVEE